MVKTSVAPAGDKSVRLSHASHVKYDYLPTYLPTAVDCTPYRGPYKNVTN